MSRENAHCNFTLFEEYLEDHRLEKLNVPV